MRDKWMIISMMFTSDCCHFGLGDDFSFLMAHCTVGFGAEHVPYVPLNIVSLYSKYPVRTFYKPLSLCILFKKIMSLTYFFDNAKVLYNIGLKGGKI